MMLWCINWHFPDMRHLIHTEQSQYGITYSTPLPYNHELFVLSSLNLAETQIASVTQKFSYHKTVTMSIDIESV